MDKDESVRFATKYLEDLLSFFGINVAVDSTLEDEVIQLSVPSTSMNSLLIGRNADNLRALQFIVSQSLAAREAEVIERNLAKICDEKLKPYYEDMLVQLMRISKEYQNAIIENGRTDTEK